MAASGLSARAGLVLAIQIGGVRSAYDRSFAGSPPAEGDASWPACPIHVGSQLQYDRGGRRTSRIRKTNGKSLASAVDTSDVIRDGQGSGTLYVYGYRYAPDRLKIGITEVDTV
jgi:hypothetical protein